MGKQRDYSRFSPRRVTTNLGVTWTFFSLPSAVLGARDMAETNRKKVFVCAGCGVRLTGIGNIGKCPVCAETRGTGVKKNDRFPLFLSTAAKAPCSNKDFPCDLVGKGNGVCRHCTAKPIRVMVAAAS